MERSLTGELVQIGKAYTTGCNYYVDWRSRFYDRLVPRTEVQRPWYTSVALAVNRWLLCNLM